MSLEDYKPEYRVFPLKGGSFSVKGLSLVEVTELIRQHMPDLEAVLDLAMQTMDGKAELTESDIGNLVVTFAEQAPGLVANVIALAADAHTEKGIAAATSLAFPVQVEVLLAICTLTFDEVGGVKKAWGLIAGLLKNKKLPKVLKPR